MDFNGNICKRFFNRLFGPNGDARAAFGSSAIDGSLKKGWTAGPAVVLGHGILEFILIIFS